MFHALFVNFAVTATALVLWGVMASGVSRLDCLRRKLAFGAAMAVGTLGSMTMAFEAAPGVLFDLRGPTIAISGLFGGAPAALLVAAAALVYRVYLGGAVLAGALGIGLTSLVGLLGHRLCRGRRIGAADLVALGVAVAVTGTLARLALPTASLAGLWPLLPPLALVGFGGTLVFGLILLQDSRRRELAAENDLYRAMVEALPDCLNIKDAEGRFLAANPATARLMNASSPEALIGKTDFDFYPAQLAERFHDDEQTMLRRGSHMTIEQPGRLPDGSLGWLATLKAPVIANGGEITGLVTHNRDITGTKALQLRLEQTQAHLDRALENMSDALVMHDAEGIILICNQRYRELFPLTAALRVPGASFADIIRASVAAGEEVIPRTLTLEAHVASKLATLRREGETLVELANGRSLAVRTRLLDGGGCLRVMSDVTERRQFERSLEHQALHDPLTGLPNRALFNRELRRLLRKATDEGGALMVMLVDLDRFKQINDSMGHAAGDALLVEVAHRLTQATRGADVAARLGGDEFAVLVHGEKHKVAGAAIAARVARTLRAPLELDGVTLMPSGTIGYTTFPDDPSGADDLLKNADRALYQAKARRRGSWKAWQPGAGVAEAGDAARAG